MSDISCDSDHFNKAAPDHNTALKKSGFNENIKYSPSQSKQRNKRRQIIWFNPPYSVNVKTNVGKLFMKLIDKHFSPVIINFINSSNATMLSQVVVACPL